MSRISETVRRRCRDEHLLTTAQVAEQIGVVRHSVAWAARTGRIPGVIYDKSASIWLIPESYVAARMNDGAPPGYVPLRYAALALGINARRLARWCKAGTIPGAKQASGGLHRWYVPRDYVHRLASRPRHRSQTTVM